MRTFSSTLALILVVIILGYPAGPEPATAQTGAAGPDRLGLVEPYRELQYAFANGFESAIKFIHREIKAGRMDSEKLDRLAANRKDRLQRLIVKMAKEYQATLIKLNKGKQNKAGAD